MSLTRGSGPFGPNPSGSFNFERVGPAHTLYWDDWPPRLRAVFAGETVLDTRRAKALHETGLLPVHYVPLDDIRMDLLTPTDHTTHCPFKGDARYWTLQVGDRVAENVMWAYPEPIPGAPPLAGHGAFYFSRLDCWYEEDEPVYAHLRDPFHRVDVRAGSYKVVVRAGGEVVAESGRPKLLFETGLPIRWYLPEEDVRTNLLTRSPTVSQCPYKGEGRHWHLRAGGEAVSDAAWSLPDPLPEAAPAAGHFCFDPEKVEVLVDGERTLS